MGSEQGDLGRVHLLHLAILLYLVLQLILEFILLDLLLQLLLLLNQFLDPFAVLLVYALLPLVLLFKPNLVVPKVQGVLFVHLVQLGYLLFEFICLLVLLIEIYLEFVGCLEAALVDFLLLHVDLVDVGLSSVMRRDPGGRGY